MTNEIRKINELQHVESFMQVDFSKGYKYVDRAGEILNIFCEEDREPVSDMRMDRLTIQKPDDLTVEVRVSPKNFWSHYSLPNSLDQIANAFAARTVKILGILDVTTLRRVGWRNYFIYEFGEGQENQRDELLSKFLPMPDIAFEGAFFFRKQGKTKWHIHIHKASKKSANPKPKPAILFDIDTYFDEYTPPLLKDTLKTELDRLRKEIKGETSLEIINSVLTK